MASRRSKPSEDEVRDLLGKLRVFLEKRYDIKILILERLDRGVFRMDRQSGRSWIVRIFPVDRPIERVQGDAEVLKFLEKNQFPAERCADPSPVTSPGGRGVLVTEFVEGTQSARDEATLFKFGELLGKLNSLPTGAIAREAGSLHHYSKIEGKPANEINAARSWLDEVERLVSGRSRAPYESLREELASADECEDLPEALIHPDPVPKNFISTPDSKLVMIDWTGAGKGPRIASLAVLIWSSVLGQEGWSLERVDPVAAGYSSLIQLEEDEINRLPSIMKLRPLVFACWRFRHAMISGKNPTGNEWWMPSEELSNAISGRAVSAFRKKQL